MWLYHIAMQVWKKFPISADNWIFLWEKVTTLHMWNLKCNCKLNHVYSGKKICQPWGAQRIWVSIIDANQFCPKAPTTSSFLALHSLQAMPLRGALCFIIGSIFLIILRSQFFILGTFYEFYAWPKKSLLWLIEVGPKVSFKAASYTLIWKLMICS